MRFDKKGKQKHTTIGRTSHGNKEKCSKRSDKRQSGKTDSGVCAAAAARHAVPAVLQHGRYDYCRKILRRESARGCWQYRFDQLHDRGILYGSLQRICDSGCADVRCRRSESTVPVCGKRSRSGWPSFGDDDRSCLHLVPRYSDSDENPVRYSGRRIRLYFRHFPRHSADGAL